MPRDYIPQEDDDFDDFGQNFVNKITPNPTSFGLTASQAAGLNSLFSAWHTAFLAHKDAQTAATAATATKDNARDALEQALREAAGIVQAKPEVTDEQRQLLHLTVRDVIRTPAGPIATRPVLTVDTSQRLRHLIRLADETTPNSRAKPEGVTAFQLWAKVDGPPPADLSECDLIAVESHSPHLEEYDAAHAGKQVHYLANWKNNRHQGPLSATVSATIPA
jgi:hypothetical protein